MKAKIMTDPKRSRQTNGFTNAVSTRNVAEILGVNVDLITLQELLQAIENMVEGRQHVIIGYVNAHAMNIAYDLAWFRTYLNECSLVFCDGFGLKWGARLLGYRLPERFTPPDWLPMLAQRCCEHDFTLFMLGSEPGVAARAAERLRTAYPNLRIVGTHHGHFDHRLGSAESAQVVRLIDAADPDILLIGFGMPLQERWLREHWGQLHVRVALPIGAAFDFLSGHMPRGPRWMTDHGLEWLSRLLTEPRRLWRRYLIGNLLFFGRILGQRFGLLHMNRDEQDLP